MGGNVFKSNSTHKPTTWQNWPEAKKPCTVQLDGHLSHTVRLKPDQVPYCMLKQMRSTVKHMILHNILQFLRKVGLKASKCVVITQVGHGDPPQARAKRIFLSKHVCFPRFFAMLPEGGP